MLTLISIGTFMVTMGTLSRDIAVGQELMSFLIIILFSFLLQQFPILIQLLEEVRSQLLMYFRGSPGINVEADSELLEALFNQRMIAVHHVLRRYALFPGSDGDGYAVFITATDEDDVFLFQAQVAHIDVGRHINSSQMTDMNSTVCVWQGRRNGCPLEFFLLHEYSCFLMFLHAKLRQIKEMAK